MISVKRTVEVENVSPKIKIEIGQRNNCLDLLTERPEWPYTLIWIHEERVVGYGKRTYRDWAIKQPPMSTAQIEEFKKANNVMYYEEGEMNK